MKKRTIIIAEAGVNHNGNIEIAKELISAAAQAGVDYIKFQTFRTENLVKKESERAAYQIKNMQDSVTQFEMLKKLELSHRDHLELIDFCKSKSIKFLSSAFDIESIEFLKDKVAFYKIPSGEITNLPYLEKIAEMKLPVIMSSGMSTLNEIIEAVKVLTLNGIPLSEIIVLHCNTEYPTPIEDVNLNAMLTIKNELGVDIGYSDHTLGIEIPIAAVAMGAVCIEKHFTLDRTMKGPDHAASLEPSELKDMISSIRNIEKALGSAKKEPTKSELKNIKIARKSIVAIKDIKKGEVFSKENIATKRPGTGISAMKWHDVLGKKANKDYSFDQLITK